MKFVTIADQVLYVKAKMDLKNIIEYIEKHNLVEHPEYEELYLHSIEELSQMIIDE